VGAPEEEWGREEEEGRCLSACTPLPFPPASCPVRQVREAFFSEGTNRRTLLMVESALIYVVLSDATFDMLDWSARGKYMLASNRECPDIWFDKSVNVVVFDG
jgi:hypothetical protein